MCACCVIKSLIVNKTTLNPNSFKNEYSIVRLSKGFAVTRTSPHTHELHFKFEFDLPINDVRKLLEKYNSNLGGTMYVKSILNANTITPLIRELTIESDTLPLVVAPFFKTELRAGCFVEERGTNWMLGKTEEL